MMRIINIIAAALAITALAVTVAFILAQSIIGGMGPL